MLGKDEYYILRRADGLARGDGWIWDGVERFDLDSEEWHARRPKDAHVVLAKASPLPDYLYISAGALVLSERAHSVFLGAHLNTRPQPTWVRVRAVDRKGREVAIYYWAKFDHYDGLEVLDRKHSKYTLFPPGPGYRKTRNGKHPVLDVSRWVLDPNAIAGIDLAFGEIFKWFASLRVRQLVEKHRLKGFAFVPVDVWHDSRARARA